MFVGLRVVKTALSIGISISIARLLHLEPSHFAGIVSMLAVQPSVYRSFRHTLSHMAAALLASLLAVIAAHLFGIGSIVIAAVAFAVMALHVRLLGTASLTLAIIVAVNTMGTFGGPYGNMDAYQHSLLVLIGMSVGTAVNFIRKPMHREREDVLLAKSESMLRTLLYYIQIEMLAGRMSPYKPDMRMQIDEVRGFIEKGKGISLLIREDRWLSRNHESGAGDLFGAYETMVERIRDIVKAMQKADLTQPEATRFARAIGLAARGQARVLEAGKPIPLYRLLYTMPSARPGSLITRPDLDRLFPYYQAYEALAEYLHELETVRGAVFTRTDTPEELNVRQRFATSHNRPLKERTRSL
jgi:hypothetical protein